MSQALWRNVGFNGLVKIYKSNSKVDEAYPTIWKLIKVFKDMETKISNQYFMKNETHSTQKTSSN